MVEGTRYRLYFARQYGLLSGLVEKLWEMSKVKPYGPLIKSEPKGVAQVIEGMQEPSHFLRAIVPACGNGATPGLSLRLGCGWAGHSRSQLCFTGGQEQISKPSFTF
jgi:hypothetical protein